MELTRYQQYYLLDCMLEMGELLLDCGAEISRVEDTLTRVGTAYGAKRTDVFVIPSLISITLNYPEKEPVTETRRIHSTGGTDFYRMEKLNSLSRDCCREPIDLKELRARLDHVAAGKKPFSVVFWGSVLGGGGFAVFFGGTLLDGLAGAIFGAGICLLQYALGRTELNPVASNLIVSLLTGLAIGIVAGLIPGRHHADDSGPGHDQRPAEHPGGQHHFRHHASGRVSDLGRGFGRRLYGGPGPGGPDLLRRCKR